MEPLLDPRTLATAAAFAAAVQALAIIYVWYVQIRNKALLYFSIGAGLAAVGAVLGMLRPQAPVLVTHVLATCILLASHAIAAYAFGVFLKRRVPALLLSVMVVVAGMVVAFFVYVSPQIEIRIAAYSICVAFNSLVISTLLLDVPKGPLRLTHWPVGFLHLAHGIFALLRAFSALIEPPRSDIFEPSLIQALWFVQSLIIVNLSFVGTVLMVTQRIRLDLDRQASEDELTGALNRRAFDVASAAEWSRAVRHDLPLSVLVLDLDRFKALNDVHGHDAGDEWLKTFAEITRDALRREDVLCRHGGEEIVVLLPQTGLEAAALAAERIRRTVEAFRADGTSASSSVSIGVAAKTSRYPDFKAMLAAADQALYRAKASGRNRVETA